MPSFMTKMQRFNCRNGVCVINYAYAKRQRLIGSSIVCPQRTLAEKMPITQITITQLVIGSSVGIYNSMGTLITSQVVTVASVNIAVQYIGEITIEVRKGIGLPTYKLWETRVTISGTPLSIIALQELD